MLGTALVYLFQCNELSPLQTGYSTEQSVSLKQWAVLGVCIVCYGHNSRKRSNFFFPAQENSVDCLLYDEPGQLSRYSD
jgi:hypothetical protein